jgi:hypothetical protein
MSPCAGVIPETPVLRSVLVIVGGAAVAASKDLTFDMVRVAALS